MQSTYWETGLQKGWVAWCRVQSTLLEGLLKPCTQLNSFYFISQMLLNYNQFSRPFCVVIELRRKGGAKGLRILPGEVYTNHNHYLQGRPPGKKKNSFSCSLQLLLLGSSHHFFQLCSWVSTSMQRWSALKNCRPDYSAQCPRQPSAGQHAPTENTTFWKKRDVINSCNYSPSCPISPGPLIRTHVINC